MLIDDNERQVTTIQIKNIRNAKNIECETVDGKFLKLHLTSAQKNDPLFWWSLVKIYTAQLWIPIMIKTQMLLENDWLQEPSLSYQES